MSQNLSHIVGIDCDPVISKVLLPFGFGAAGTPLDVNVFLEYD